MKSVIKKETLHLKEEASCFNITKWLPDEIWLQVFSYLARGSSAMFPLSVQGSAGSHGIQACGVSSTADPSNVFTRNSKADLSNVFTMRSTAHLSNVFTMSSTGDLTNVFTRISTADLINVLQ